MLDGAIERIRLASYQGAQEKQHGCVREPEQKNLLHAYEDQDGDGRRSEESNHTKIVALRNLSTFFSQLACQHSFHLARIGCGWNERQITNVRTMWNLATNAEANA
jgi:hypothetical protein